jgi:hypothetical protein
MALNTSWGEMTSMHNNRITARMGAVAMLSWMYGLMMVMGWSVHMIENAIAVNERVIPIGPFGYPVVIVVVVVVV